MAAMVIIIVTSTSRATSCMAEPEPTATDVELLGSTTTEAPVVGDCVPEELMPAIQCEAGARGWSALPLTFGGCSVTGPIRSTTKANG